MIKNKNYILKILLAIILIIQYTMADDKNTKWCDSISHKNSSCPKYAEIKAKEHAEHLKWCDSVKHQSYSCPKKDDPKLKREVDDKRDKDQSDWCEKINHQNYVCPKYGMKDNHEASVDDSSRAPKVFEWTGPSTWKYIFNSFGASQQ